MFVGQRRGKAAEAVRFYTWVFREAKVGDIFPVKYASFTLEGQDFYTMDSAREHDFSFNEAISFIVNCANQEQLLLAKAVRGPSGAAGSRISAPSPGR
jgi:predicted 3-demethylubiquinone-9 3-methyltransferase (glyoxalase superfamily)